MNATIQAKEGFYLLLSLSMVFFILIDDLAAQDQKLSSREYILLEEELMDFQDSTPRVEIQIIGSDSVDSAFVTPSEALPSQKGSWTFTYLPRSGDFISGGRLMLEIPFAFLPSLKSWTYPQINSPTQEGYVKVRASNPSTGIAVSRGGNLPFNYSIRATFSGAPPVIGDTITFTYGDTSGSLNGAATSNVHATIYEFRILTDKNGSNSWKVVTPVTVIRVVSKSAKHFQITTPSLLTVEDSLSAVFVAFDEYNNIDTKYSGTLDVACFGGSDCGAQSTVVFSSTDSGRVVIYFRSGEGEHQLIAKNSSGAEFFSNPYIVSTAPHEYNLFWGDIQNHTNISDGNGSIEDFYNYARNIANLDFVALTDHDHSYGRDYLTADIWEKIREFARVHDSDGKFVSFLGWEWTNERRGHKHIIYPGDDAEPYNHTTYPLPSDLWAALEGETALTISHHIAWGFRKVDWNFRNDKFHRIVEIYSQHAANEYYLNPLDHKVSSGRADGHYVRDALAMGHKLGILASSDGHFGYPGNGWMWAPTALDSTSRATGLTGIYADTLTRESLFEALVDRRVFGTTDHRTIIGFKVNGEWMGTEIQSDSLPLIQGSILSHTRIKNVEIVKFNGINYEIIGIDLDGAEFSFEFSYRDSLYVRNSFYYLRVTSAGNVNDRFAWSSPVWVDKPIRPELVNLPVTGEYGYFLESDSLYKYEIGFSFRSDAPPFSISDILNFEAYNIHKEDEVSIFANGIFLSYADTTGAKSWGTTKSLTIPKYLVDTVNVIRFENTNASSNSEFSECGVRDLNISSNPISFIAYKTDIIGSYALKQNYPNPFNPITTIDYYLPYSSELTLIIFNLKGQEVARLVDEEKPVGTHSAKWDASTVSSGIYFYRLQASPTSVWQAGDFVQTKKMVLLK